MASKTVYTIILCIWLGSFQSCGVIKQAYQLNNPVRVVPGRLTSGDLFSFAAVDTDAVILDTCKKSDIHE